MAQGEHTRREILSQPDAWSAALGIVDEHLRAISDLHPTRRFDHMLYTGCGSAYYLCLAAAALTQELTGLPARALPASELWLSPSSSFTSGRTLLVAVSRSGETTETFRACEAFLAGRRGRLLTLTCYPETPLAQLGTLNIVLPSGQEQSVAQTRAFSSLYLATVAIAALWAARDDLYRSLTRLPQAGARLLDTYAPLASELGRDLSLDRFYFLGSGPRYGLASELSLKMKEMSLSHSEPFHFMEFRHGPKSMVTDSTLVIGLRSAVNASLEDSVLHDVGALGAHLLSLGESGTTVQFDAGLDEAVSNALYLPVGQLLALERALCKGLDPDRPQHLEAVVRLLEKGGK